MAIMNKNSYPKAIPAHSLEDLASHTNRLSQSNDELAAHAKRLASQNKTLAETADRWRRWALYLSIACGIAVLVATGAMTYAYRQPRQTMPIAENVEPDAPKIASPTLPTNALAKSASASGSGAGGAALESLGGLSATHLFQSYLNIGLLADSVESETYTVEDAEKHLQSVADMMKLVDTQLAKLSKSGLDADDQDSIRQIQAVSALLHLQVRFLRGYWSTGDAQQALDYHEAREASWTGLSKVLGSE